jgi:hypothetical protein
MGDPVDHQAGHQDMDINTEEEEDLDMVITLGEIDLRVLDIRVAKGNFESR